MGSELKCIVKDSVLIRCKRQCIVDPENSHTEWSASVQDKRTGTLGNAFIARGRSQIDLVFDLVNIDSNRCLTATDSRGLSMFGQYEPK